MAAAKKRRKKSDNHPPRPQMRRHSSGQARVTLSGRTYYLGVFGSIEATEKYVTLIKQWEANGREALEPVATVVTQQKKLPAKTMRQAFAEYESYLDETGRYRKNGKKTSERSMLTLAITELLEGCGDKPIHDLDESVLLIYRDKLERKPRLTRKGINRKIQMIKRCLRWMRPRGIITRDQWLEFFALEPLKRGELPADRERTQPKRAVSLDDVEAVADEAGQTVGTMMWIQVLTSMRPGEACAMRWQDIDMTPQLFEGQACWTYHVAQAKTAHHGHKTSYPLPPQAQEMLIHIGLGESGHVFSPKQAMQDRHDILREGRTTPPTKQMRDRDSGRRRTFKDHYTVGDYAQAVDRALARTKVARFTPHELRHSFLTRGARKFGVIPTSKAANHRNISTTQGYLHAEPDDAMRVVVGLAKDVGDKFRGCLKTTAAKQAS